MKALLLTLILAIAVNAVGMPSWHCGTALASQAGWVLASDTDCAHGLAAPGAGPLDHGQSGDHSHACCSAAALPMAQALVAPAPAPQVRATLTLVQPERGPSYSIFKPPKARA